MYMTKLKIIALCFIIFIHTYNYIKNKDSLYRTTFQKGIYLLVVITSIMTVFIRWLP